MADSLGALIDAIDKYMAQNAKAKTNGPYMATKFAAIFEDPNSVFNPDGVLQKVTEKLKENFEDMTTSVEIFDKIMDIVIVNTKDMGKMFKKSHDSLSTFINHISSFKADLAASKKFIPKSKSISSIEESITPPKVPYDFAKENALKESKIVEVRIVGMADSIIEKFNHWFANIKVNQEVMNDNRIPTTNAQKQEGKGLLSTVFGWIKNALKAAFLITGGLYLAGKLKQFFNETELGKTIKQNTSAFLKGISKYLTSFFNSGEFGRGMSDGIKFVSEVVKSIWNGLSSFWDKNKEAISKAFSDTGNALDTYIIQPFLNNILKPMWADIKQRVKSIDWSETMGKIKDWFWNNVLAPMGEWIAKDFRSGDAEEGFAKILGIGALGTVILGMTGTLGAVVTGLTSVVGILGVGTSVGLVAGLALLYKTIEEGNKTRTLTQESLNSSQFTDNIVKQSLTKNDKDIQDLQQRIKYLQKLSPSIEKDNELILANKKIALLQKKVEKDEQFRSLNEEAISIQRDMMETNSIIMQTWKAYKLNQVNDKLQSLSIDRQKVSDLIETDIKHYENLRSQIQTQKSNPYIFPKSITPLSSGKEKFPDIFPAIKSKYIDLFAPKKENHNLSKIKVELADTTPKTDKSNSIAKQANEKIDTIVNVLVDGFNTLVQATIQNGGQVANAVASSSKGSGQTTPASTMGGENHIKAFRNHVAHSLR